MANELADVKVLLVFGEKTVIEVDEAKLGGDIIAGVISGDAISSKRERKEYPDEKICVLIDEAGFFVGCQVFYVVSTKNEYRTNDTLKFYVGRIVDDGRIVLVKFAQQRGAAWRSSSRKCRRGKKESRYETIVVRKDGVVSGPSRRFVDVEDVDVLEENPHCYAVTISQDGEADRKADLEWRRAQLRETIVKNFSALPEAGKDIVSKSRDIIRETIAKDDSLTAGYY